MQNPSIPPLSPVPAAAPAPTDALVTVNLGTPEAATAPAVRRYLAEFLSDRRVVAIPPLFWQPLLRGVILPLRGPKSAAKYAKVWLPGGSPLMVHTRHLAEAIQSVLPTWRVVHAMRYGTPALAPTLAGLRDQGIARCVVLPLYPQYSTTTTASISDVLQRFDGGGMAVSMIEDYPLDPGWVEAVAASIRAHWDANGRAPLLVFSFHGLPQRVARAGDPYPIRCEASAAAIAAALGLDASQWRLTYQSRFGSEKWLEPATDRVLQALAAEGVLQVDVACPGFAVDCLETLEEVGMQFAEEYHAVGGELRYIPCLNAAPAHAAALARLATDHARHAFAPA